MVARAVADTVTELFHRRGSSLYGGEAVTQCEHALQAAQLAEQSGSTPALIIAALLHDVGHLLHELPEDAPDDGLDDVHEQLGDRWLRRYFGAEVCDPVRLHVDAKRYLCATDPAYKLCLSPPSLFSLELQGGAFTETEAKQFATEAFFQESITLRRWDDLAKVPGLPTAELAHFLKYLPACVLSCTEIEATL